MRIPNLEQISITRSQFLRPFTGLPHNHIPLKVDTFSAGALPFFDSNGFTPNANFYNHIGHSVVNVDVSHWRLIVGGLVERSLQLSFDEVQEWQTVEKSYTLTAVTSTPRNLLVGHALWRGVPLKAIFQSAIVRSEAFYAQFRSVNGYSTYLPLNRLEDGLLAYEMNGEPLSADQGFPVRLIVPGVYDYKMPKWVQSIELVAASSTGHYESRGWSADGLVQTTSAIFTPYSREEINGKVIFSGMAFAGTRSITKIELNIDDGEWMPVPFVAAESGSWTRWQIDWMPPAPGDYLVKVRATDSDGFTQSDQPDLTVFPNGTRAIHAVVFRASM